MQVNLIYRFISQFRSGNYCSSAGMVYSIRNIFIYFHRLISTYYQSILRFLSFDKKKVLYFLPLYKNKSKFFPCLHSKFFLAESGCSTIRSTIKNKLTRINFAHRLLYSTLYTWGNQNKSQNRMRKLASMYNVTLLEK
jgi:hypothetical protein